MKDASTVQQMMSRVFDVNDANGFWPEEPRSVAQIRALISSEVSEALEATRNNKHLDQCTKKEGLDFMCALLQTDETTAEHFKEWFKDWVKDTFECEIADVAIRCLDTLEGVVRGRLEGYYDPPSDYSDLGQSLAHMITSAATSIKDTLPKKVVVGDTDKVLFERLNYLQKLTLGIREKQVYGELDSKPSYSTILQLDVVYSCIWTLGMCQFIAEAYDFPLNQLIELTVYNNSLRPKKHGKSF